jgi:hypothetical protein
MAAIDRGHIAANLWPGILVFWGLAYKDYPEQWRDLYDVKNSQKAYERLQGEFGFGLAAMKDPGKSVLFDEAGNTWSSYFKHEAYALGFIVTREAIKDNLYAELIPKYTNALKRSMRHTREILAAAVYDRSTNAAYKGGDGKSLAAHDHPLRNGGTLDNLGYGVDLNETSLEAATITIADWTDERGLKIMAMPMKLVVANGNQFAAQRMWTATDVRQGTSDRDLNAWRTMGILPRGYSVNNYLTARRQWYLQTDQPEGMIAFNREPLDVQQGDGMDNQVLKVMGYERYSHGWNDPRGLFIQPG